MPVPRFMATVNKHLFNPRALEKGSWPVLTHVGRTSGKTYRTPLDAFAIDNGYLFVIMYGEKTDWVQNVLAAGNASLKVEGQQIDLTNPRIVDKDEAIPLLPAGAKHPPGFLGVNEYLQMTTA